MTEANNDLYLEDEDTMKGKFLTFKLDDGIYGIGIQSVTEIIGIMAITEVPELPSFVKGVINLRGRIIPVMDVRIRFGKPYVEYNERTCIVVVDIRGNFVGLVVDSVEEVTNIAEDDIVPTPELNINTSNKYINGIGKSGNQVQLLLDCEELLSIEEMSELKQL